MDDLVVPETFAGPWQSILILTYGAELPFFERTLARRLGDRCRNRVILADGQRHLESCLHYARGALVHSLNQHYVADGVMTRHAMHAKAILLVSSDAGRLLVGSGNLGFQGYASGGELFTHYEYTRDQPDDLAAFLAIRELLEILTERRYLGSASVRHIELMLEAAPWLYQAPPDGRRPLRHNLQQSFLEQLADEVAGEEVEHLVLLAPFYDAEAKALREVIETFSPARIEVLVQPGRTSVSPKVLATLQQHYPYLAVRPFRKGVDDPYVHAKLLLFKLAHRAIAFQGSANVSQVALLLAEPSGNVELANIATGVRDAFDPLLDALEIGTPIGDVGTLDLGIEPIQDLPEQLTGFHLIRGELTGRTLRLEHRGDLPSLEGASLLIQDDAFSFKIEEVGTDELELALDDEACQRLQQAVPVRLTSADLSEAWASNPIYVCNRHALDRTLKGPSSSERLTFVGALGELDDEELEQLLTELADTVVIDHEDLRRLASEVQGARSEQAEGEAISYDEIDYELLRQHPKLRQYLLRGKGGGGAERSRIQLVLQSITQHFRDYTRPKAPSYGPAGLTIIDETDAETEEEVEEAAEASEQRRERTEQHLRLVFQNFIRRYLKGVTTEAFQRDAGFELVTQNYLIFSHVLWALFRKPWMPPRFLVESLARVWEEFWGAHAEQPGYFDRLPAGDRELAQEWLEEHHAQSLLFASLYYCAYLTRVEDWEDERFRLRDVCRALLARDQPGFSAANVPDALNALRRLLAGKPPTTTGVISELQALADFETRTSFMNSVPQQLGLPPGTIQFDEVVVMRPARRRQEKVACLIIDTGKVDEATTLALLARWMEFESLGHYRIQNRSDSGPVCYFDVDGGGGIYWDRHSPARELSSIPRVDRPWLNALARIGDEPPFVKEAAN